MSHHNNVVNIYGHQWTAPTYQIAESWREFLNNPSFSLESEDSMRENNSYVDVVYKLTKRDATGSQNITAGSPLVATGEIIDGKIVVEAWADEAYATFTPPADGTHIVGRFDPWPIFGFTTTTMWINSANGTSVVPASGGPVVDPNDSNVAYFHGPMLTRGYMTMSAMGFNWNEHFFQSGMPSYIGYKGAENAYAADDSWHPTTNESSLTYIGRTPSAPTNPARGAFYFAGPFTT